MGPLNVLVGGEAREIKSGARAHKRDQNTHLGSAQQVAANRAHNKRTGSLSLNDDDGGGGDCCRPPNCAAERRWTRLRACLRNDRERRWRFESAHQIQLGPARSGGRAARRIFKHFSEATVAARQRPAWSKLEAEKKWLHLPSARALLSGSNCRGNCCICWAFHMWSSGVRRLFLLLRVSEAARRLIFAVGAREPRLVGAPKWRAREASLEGSD